MREKAGGDTLGADQTLPTMKLRFALPLFAVALLAASQPALAAAKKGDSRTAELVAALQAVSPDPLGGRLGLEVSVASAPALAPTAAKGTYANQSPRAALDQRSYMIWKSSLKS
jgi:hypothetical protein